MKVFVNILSVFLMSIFLYACDGNKVYEEYVEVVNADWKKENIANFSFNITDTVSPHNLYLNIRNTSDYPYSNMYLFVKIKGPDGNFNVDTVNCQLADKRGKWLGKGIGDLWDLKIPYIGGFKFVQSGEYNVSFEQAMRVDNGLKGISDVGLRVEKTED